MRLLRWCALAFTLILALAFIAVWQSPKTQVVFVPYKVFAAHPHTPVTRLTFSPDGQFLVTRGQGDRVVKVWRVKDGQLAYIVAVTPAQPIRFAFSPDGSLLAIAYADSTVRIFNAIDGKLKRAFRYSVQVNWLGQIAFSPDGKQLAQTWNDPMNRKYCVLVWKVASGKLVRVLTLSSQPIGIAFSSDGRYLVSVHQDIFRRHLLQVSNRLVLRLWDTQSWQKRTLDFAQHLPFHLANHYETVVFLSDCQRLLVPISWAEKAFVLRFHPKQVEQVFRVPTFPYALHPKSGVTWHLGFTYDVQNDMLVVVKERGIAWWIYQAMSLPFPSLIKKRLQRSLMQNLRRTKQVIQCYRVTDGRKETWFIHDAGAGWIHSLALSTDGRYLAAGLHSGEVIIWARKH